MEKEFLKSHMVKGEYRSPKAKVIEVKLQSIMCSSLGGEEDEGNESAHDGGVIDLD